MSNIRNIDHAVETAGVRPSTPAKKKKPLPVNLFPLLGLALMLLSALLSGVAGYHLLEDW